jgi:hypothetical protein
MFYQAKRLLALAIALSTVAGAVLLTSRIGYASVSAVTQAQLSTLNEINLDGWDSSTSELYINWIASNPGTVNQSDSGPMSCNPTCKDAMVDLRDLVDMETFEHLNPGDTSQQAAIGRLLPKVKSMEPGAAGMHPWAYDLFLELYTDTGDSAWLSIAKSYVSSYLRKYSTALNGIPDTFYNSTKCNSDAVNDYRPDHQLQMAADFIDAQKRFGLNSAADGVAMAKQTVTDGFNSSFDAFARVVCIRADNSRYVGDSQVKVGEISDSLLGVADLYTATGDSTWLNLLQSELDSLVSGRLSQLHDATDLGFGYEIIMPGGATTPCSTGTGCVNNSYREIRQYLLLPIVHRADQYLNNRYAALDSELQTSVLAAWHGGTHPGWPYRENMNYSWFVQGSVTENWITTEAMGIAIHGLLFDQANPVAGATPSPSPTSSPSSGSTATPTPTPYPSPTASPTPAPSTSPIPSPIPGSSNCPVGSQQVTGNINGGTSQSEFVAASSTTLCAHLSWSNSSASLQLIVYNSQGTTVLTQNISGVAPETIGVNVTSGTKYKVKVRSPSGNPPTAFTLVVNA